MADLLRLPKPIRFEDNARSRTVRFRSPEDPPMHDPHHSKPSADDALFLHQRLLERDPVAPADFAVAFLKPLIAWLRRTNPGVDPVACEEAAGEAIVCFLN